VKNADVLLAAFKKDMYLWKVAQERIANIAPRNMDLR
jgi:hypothetical protein